jgi:hypothetical protein
VYSPKIPDRLIPALYRLGRARGEPMTRLVAEAIERFLADEGMPPDPGPRDAAGPERLTVAPELEAAPSRAAPVGPAW